MTDRMFCLALLLTGCGTGGTGRVEVSMGSASAQTARVTAPSDDAPSFVGELYLNVVEVNARYEPSSDPMAPACGYGDEGFEEDDGEDEDGSMEDEDEGGEWVTLSEAAVAVNLTGDLSSHEDPIAIAELAPGAVTELRFVLDEEEPATWILPSGEHIAVTVPSGSSSGLKLKGCMPIQVDYATVIHITVDIEDAMHETGNGEVKLRPSLSVVADLVADAD